MLSLVERVSRQRSLKNWGLLLLTALLTLIPVLGQSVQVMGQDEPAAESAPADALRGS